MEKLLAIINEELIELRKLVTATQRTAEAAEHRAEAAQKSAEAAQKSAEASQKKADATWEMVIITRNEVQERLDYMKKPWWKKFFNLN